MKALEQNGRKVLRYIHDQGRVNANALRMDSHFNEMVVNNFLARALPRGLILYANNIISVKEEFKEAVDFVFDSEYDQDLKD